MSGILQHIAMRDTQFFMMIHGSVIFTCWVCLCVAVMLDFFSGTYAAKKAGERISSHGFRRSIVKILTYGSFLIIASMFDTFAVITDYMANFIVDWYKLPFGCMCATLAVAFVEGKSMYENYKKAKLPAADLPGVSVNLLGALSKVVLPSNVEKWVNAIRGMANKQDNISARHNESE